MWGKKKGTIEWDKRTVMCDTGTTQYEDKTVKCEKKSKGTNQCDKNRANVMLILLNMTMELSNLRKKNKIK